MDGAFLLLLAALWALSFALLRGLARLGRAS